MRRALHAEWTKLRTVAAPRWLLLGTIVATVALSAGATAVVPCGPATCTGDPTRLSLTGVHLGQALIVILAVLLISGEHSTGLIRTTLTATPNRTIAYAAKALTLTTVTTAAATPAVLGSLLAGRHILSHHGHPAPPLTDAATLRATTGTVLYLTLIALLSLGTAATLRDAATSIGVTLALLYLLPLLSQVIGNPHTRRLLHQLSPTTAGLTIQATTNLTAEPLTPWTGLAVTAAWATAALTTGAILLHTRDA